MRGSNDVAIGYDEGSVMIKVLASSEQDVTCTVCVCSPPPAAASWAARSPP